MMNELVFDVCRVIATVIGIVIAYYIVPALKALIKQHLDTEMIKFIKACVYAAEQTLTPKDGTPNGGVKKKFVEKEVSEWLTSKGIKITDTQLDVLIESAVLAMNTEIK